MYIKAENWGLDMPESPVYPASLFNLLDFRLNPRSSTAFWVFRLGSGNRLPGSLSFCCRAV
jgi:hypothetical protein